MCADNALTYADVVDVVEEGIDLQAYYCTHFQVYAGYLSPLQQLLVALRWLNRHQRIFRHVGCPVRTTNLDRMIVRAREPAGHGVFPKPGNQQRVKDKRKGTEKREKK